jgi:methylthioribose-1-phosphate isomerase
MKINGTSYRSIWVDKEDHWSIRIFDQTCLPWELVILRLTDADQAAHAIRSMQTRGAPLIGVTAAYGLALALRADGSRDCLHRTAAMLNATRPTAVNLRWALARMVAALEPLADGDRATAAYREAAAIADEDAANCAAIGQHGLSVLQELAAKKSAQPKTGQTLNILTHCNAGWLATVDHGTALSPIYAAHDSGMNLHVWVDETRPRNQGAALTAFELSAHGVPHTVIADNAGGHLMQHGQVDMVIVGTDRVTRSGDVANKIGTYLKALAARDNNVPFWVACPASTIDWTVTDGVRDIPIEERSGDEVTNITGRDSHGKVTTMRVVAEGSPAANPAFDVTPARLVTGFMTEKGCCDAREDALTQLFQAGS